MLVLINNENSFTCCIVRIFEDIVLVVHRYYTMCAGRISANKKEKTLGTIHNWAEPETLDR